MPRLLVRDVLLGALAQHVEGEGGALLRVDGVGLGVVGELAVLLRFGEAALDLGRVGPELLQTLTVVVRRALDAPAQDQHHLFELMSGRCRRPASTRSGAVPGL